MTDGRRALVIGIDAYAYDPLAGCVTDAEDFAAALTLEQYGFDVDVIRNGEATRRNIVDNLWSIAEGRGDTFVIFFAGHGLIQGAGGYLVTIDGVHRDPGVSLVELAQIIADASLRYQHTILVLDCCHAGSGQTWVNERPLTIAAVESEVSVVNSSRVLLAACKAEQKAKEIKNQDGAARGRFSKALIDGMLGGAVDFDGNITMHSLADYIVRSIDPAVQTPVFRGDIAGSVILGSGFEPRVGRPIDPSRQTAVMAKAQQFIDEYHVLQAAELSQLSRRQETGLKKCCRKLSEVVRWFDETELSLPDVKREKVWQKSRDAITNYRAAVADIRIGDQLPGGKVERRIGAGGFGVVWEIVDGDSRQAYKVLHGADLTDPIKPQRFRNGYSSMQALEHPRIVRVKDLTETPLGFVMEYIDGSDLRDAFVDRADGSYLLELAFQIADTVRYAHGAKVVHRDIKPENVILAWDSSASTFVPHLTDFDLAYIETNQTMTVASAGVGGVIHYAAPEQFYASSSAVARAATVDVYAFAQLLYFLICGGDPRAERPDGNRANFRRRVSELYLQGPAEVLIALYEQSSEPNPKSRPQSMENVCAAVLRARVLHMAGVESAALVPDEVCRRVGYAYAGVERYQVVDDGISMASRSNTLNVTLRPLGAVSSGRSGFAFEVSSNDQMGLPGVASGAAARQKFDQRIDRRLQRYSFASRTAAGRGFYGAKITLQDIELSADGVSKLTEVLTSVISAIEDGT